MTIGVVLCLGCELFPRYNLPYFYMLNIICGCPSDNQSHKQYRRGQCYGPRESHFFVQECITQLIVLLSIGKLKRIK
jgi:hypothetical protein